MNSQLKISIIICTFNRAKYLKHTLHHLANQTLEPSYFEVLIIDNNSMDNTALLCQQFIADHPELQMSYHVEPEQGLSYARNSGIRKSQGDYLAFIDDDAYARNSYVENVAQYFDQHESTLAIGGKIVPNYEGAAPKWMSKYLLPLVAALDMGDRVKPFPGSKFPIGANMVFRKSTFERYGDFDIDLGRKGEDLEAGEEKDLFLRLKKHNEGIYYVPSVVVDHFIPESRVEQAYIKRQAIGIGTSERKRLKKLTIGSRWKKAGSELYKMAGSLVLAVVYCLTLQFSKASMLLKFRFWVWQGLRKG